MGVVMLVALVAVLLAMTCPGTAIGTMDATCTCTDVMGRSLEQKRSLIAEVEFLDDIGQKFG